MVLRCCGAFQPDGVSGISDGIPIAEEIWGAVHIPHWQGEVEADEGLGVGWMGGDENREAGDVFWSDLDAHTRVGRVNLERKT